MYNKIAFLYVIQYKKHVNGKFICDNIQKKATPKDGFTTNRKKVVR